MAAPQQSAPPRAAPVPSGAPDRILGAQVAWASGEGGRRARRDLRAQIARLERELATVLAGGFPWTPEPGTAGPAGGPRIAGLAELERARDHLAWELERARAEVAGRARSHARGRALLAGMLADPAGHRWTRVAAADVGLRGCGTWHCVPRLGPLGLLLGWWRVRISSGCPLATGPRASADPSAGVPEGRRRRADRSLTWLGRCPTRPSIRAACASRGYIT